MEYFKAIKAKASSLGLTADQIVKVIQLIEEAKSLNVEMHVVEGKLKMRKIDKEDKSKLDELFGKNNNNIFGNLFGDIFGGK